MVGINVAVLPNDLPVKRKSGVMLDGALRERIKCEVSM